MDLTPAHFSQAPAHSTPGTVDGLQPATPGALPILVPWGQISGNIANQLDLAAALAAKAETATLNAHTSDLNNPHQVTKAQVGLSQVDNTSDLNKPVSIAQAAAIAGVSIPSGQITDASALGRQLLTNATAAQDRAALGSGAAGDALFLTGTAAAARGVLGSGANGDALFTGATAAANRGTLGASASGDTVFTGTAAAGRTALGATAVGANIFTAADAAAVRTLIELPLMPFGQCYVVIDGSNLRLNRFNGKYLFINGSFREIPNPGPTLAPTGATPDTVYNIYAFWNGSAIELERSTTARATDTTWGHQIKSGDPTRTLVAKAYVTSGPAWIGLGTSSSVGGLINWYNRKLLTSTGVVPTSHGITTTTPSEANAACRAYFLSWGEDQHSAQAVLSGQTSTLGVVIFSNVAIGHPGGVVTGPSLYFQSYTNNGFGGMSPNHDGSFTENSGTAIPNSLSYATPWIWNNTGGNNWTNLVGNKCSAIYMG